MQVIGSALGIDGAEIVIEVGSGIGTACLLGNALWNARFIGVEPCANTYGPLRDAIPEFRRSNSMYSYESVASPGEDTGLPSDCADVILSSEVLEHVQDPRQVVFEMYRLLKPGGWLFVSTCSYSSFYEGHYRCFWLPFLGPEVGASWVRQLGYNPKFLSEINFITRRQLLSYFEAAGFRDVQLGWHYPWVTPPPLTVTYPEGFSPINSSKRKSFWQRFVVEKHVHNILAGFGMEYKLYLEARKS